MRRKALLKRIAETAKSSGVDSTLVEGGRHTLVKVGSRAIPVPRHSEINEFTAKAILRDVEAAVKEAR